MIYELRIYSCLPNRLPVLLKRFEHHTLKIWENHGIKQIGFWTVLIGDGNNDLHYLLAWESLAEREKKWNTLPPTRPGSKPATTARRTGRSLPTSKARSCGRRHSRR